MTKEKFKIDCDLPVGERLQSKAAGSICTIFPKIFRVLLIAIITGTGYNVLQAQSRPELFFREDWKETEAALPVTQEHVAHPALELHLHGAGKDGIKKSNHPHIPNDPFYIWSGECRGNWAVSLRHKNQMVDLTGPAEVHWQSKQSGFRQLRLIVKLAGGKWLVSDQYDGESADWREHSFKISELRWRELNMERISEGKWVEDPDLSMVEEIGFTDLMEGGHSAACSRLDWIAVYGKPAGTRSTRSN